jgi:hypothetical protein
MSIIKEEKKFNNQESTTITTNQSLIRSKISKMSKLDFFQNDQ